MFWQKFWNITVSRNFPLVIQVTLRGFSCDFTACTDAGRFHFKYRASLQDEAFAIVPIHLPFGLSMKLNDFRV